MQLFLMDSIWKWQPGGSVLNETAQLFHRQAALDIEVKVFKPMMRIKDILSLIMPAPAKIISIVQ